MHASPFWNRPSTDEQCALLLQDGSRVTYRELYAAADAFAALLPRRSLVLIRVGNNLPTVAAYLGCLRHGHVCLPVSKDTHGSMLETLCRTYAPDYIYAPSADGSYTLQEQNPADSPTPLHADLRVLLSTSGSTGSPKLVRLTANNLQANACSIASYLELTAEDRPVTNLPLYYSYGLSVLNSHLLVGASILLTGDSLISPAFWSFCRENGVTSMAGVPYTYDMLEALSFRTQYPATLRCMTQAGGHMSAEMVQKYAAWAAENNIRFYVMYGQTEATARMSYLPPAAALSKPGSIGIAIPGGAFSLLDEEGAAITAPDISGELLYSGANVCMGYAECRADLALGDSNGGQLHTGDVARRDADGYYYITGRMKRFLKIAGNRFGLDELERRFAEEGIDAVCGGTDGRLLVAVTDEAQKKPAAAFLKNTWHLMRNQYEVRVVARIPRSATGKILYAELFA